MTSPISGVNVQPSVPSIPTVEGGGGSGTGGGGGGTGGDGGVNGTDTGGSGDTADSGQVMVCVELASGNLQRNVSVNVMTVSSPYSTGIYMCMYTYTCSY